MGDVHVECDSKVVGGGLIVGLPTLEGDWALGYHGGVDG